LPNLQKRNYYPVDECLRLCTKFKIHDAAIYLMQTTGANKDALNLSITVKNLYNKYIDYE